MKKQNKIKTKLKIYRFFLQKAEETANRAACALFKYGWVVLTAIIEICALTETAWNIALAETINWPIAIAGAVLNILTAAIFAGAIKELRKAKQQSTQL